MAMKAFLSTAFALFLFVETCFAQNDTTAWYNEDKEAGTLALSIGMGYYFSGDNSAYFYNGQSDGRLNFLLNQPQIESQLRDAFDGYDFELAEYARDIRYTSTISFSLGIDYRLKNKWQISAYFNQVRLQAAGIFTFRVNRQNPNNQIEPYLEQVNIGGQERRSQIQLALGKRIVLENNLYTLVEAGIDFTFVEPEKNQFEVDRIYSLPITLQNNGVANNPLSTGVGFMVGTGIGYQLPASYGLVLKGTFVNTRIRLGDSVDERVNVFVPTLAFTKAF
jgi:hypothetical protein